MRKSHVLRWFGAALMVTLASIAWWQRDRELAATTSPLEETVKAQAVAPAALAASPTPKKSETPANFDHRAAAAGSERRQAAREQSRAERRAAVARLQARVPSVRVDFDEALGSPSFIASTRKFLTSADGRDGAIPPERLAQFAPDDPARLIKSFLDEYHDLFGHDSAVLQEAKLARDYTTPHNGLQTWVWQQELDGIRIFESTLQAHVTQRGELVNIASRLVPNPAAAAPDHATATRSPSVDARAAVSAAGASVGETVPVAQIAENAPPVGLSQKQEFRSSRLLEVSAEYVWLPEDESALRLCWEVIFVSKARGEMFRALVDTVTGEVVVRQGLTEAITAASYRVFTSDSPSPMSPGHATPSSVQPPQVARTLVTTTALNTTASPNGWINDGGNETLGNNVDAHTDTNADNSADLPRPQGSPSRVFDFPLDLTQAPSTYQNAAVTQLFYWCNLVHDRLYELGFTEAAGNFQTNNFSRGGTGNDAVQADAQDGSGTNNANFSTPPDGSAGRMQMYLFSGPTPDIDGDFDAEIVLHEYTHGLSNRLVGGGVGISSLQPRGMGEGWSDFYGLCLLSQPADNPNSTYAAGAYATYQFSGMTQNYYFGIRRYPYCTDLAKNPLTFKDIDPVQASSHSGVPRSSIVGTTANEVHNMGEVWCVTLWDARANLIAKHGATAGNDLILQLATDGMKLAPANPNFLQARDAIVQADLVNNAGANAGELWSAFAKRGMGAAATSPVSSTTTGLVEASDIPDDLAVAPFELWSITEPAGGLSFATKTYTLVNTGDAPLNWAASKIQPWLALSATSGTLAPGASGTVVASFTAAARGLASGTYTDAIIFKNTTSGLSQSRAVALTVEPIVVPIVTENWEGGSVASAWTITGTNTHRTAVTTANVPHGGLYHLTMDSSTDESYSRNEATWTVNLAGRNHVQLRFWVKMFNDEANGPPASPFTGGADFDGVAISADGTNWYEVQDLRTYSASWTRYVVDLDAAIAARGLSYNSNFKIRFNHYDNYTIPTDGFAFDDIELVETYDATLVVALPGSTDEGAGAISGKVTAIPTPVSDLTVALASSSPGQASVPASVVIPAGQSSVTFPFTVVDDALVDGTQSVVVTASAVGFVSRSATIAVNDNEANSLQLSLPATVGEGAGTVAGTLTLATAPDVDVSVVLASSAPAEVQSTTVVVPAGQKTATFNLSIVDDARIDGAVTTTITAQVANWTTSSADITVTDNEPTDLRISLPASAREGDGPLNGSVQIAGTLSTALTVSLSSNDPTEVTVPANVTIAAGKTTASFAATVVDDSEADGAQPVTVRATASGFSDASAGLSIADNEAHHFVIEPVASPQMPNALFTVSVSARDVNDALIANFNSPVGLTARGGQGTLTTAPSVLNSWVNGAWTGKIKLSATPTSAVLIADDGHGHTGESNAFDLAYGSVDHFGWASIASPQTLDTPFLGTVTALDAGDNPVSSFQGTASLKARTPFSKQVDIGTNAGTMEYPLRTLNHDTRMSSIYLASELGGAQRLSSLSLYVGSLPGGTLNAWTIRMKHTAMASFASNSWETGFSTVYQSNETISATGWVTFQFSTPFDYDGTSNLMVDFSYNNSASATPSGTTRYSSFSTARSLYYSTNSAYGDPLLWSGSSAPSSQAYFLPDVRLNQNIAPSFVAANPPATTNFTNGSWTGNISVPFTGEAISFLAEDGNGHAGLSNPFSVQAATIPTGPFQSVYSDPFESTTLNPNWKITGTNYYSTTLSTANTPHAGARHLVMTATSYPTYSRNEATLTLDLAGRRNVTLSFWAKEFSDTPHGPPPLPFTNGADFDGLAISTDGVNWYEVQDLRGLSSAWALISVNLDAAVAKYGLSYNSTFKIRFNQYGNDTLPYNGIAIDDLVVSASQLSTVTLTTPEWVQENSGTSQGSIRFSSPRSVDTTIALISTAPARLSVPFSVLVRAGDLSATFPLAAQNNSIFDGDRIVTVVAVPPDTIPVLANTVVRDDETTTLAMVAPASATEGGPNVTGTLTLGATPSGALVFTLSSSDTSELTVPATVSFAPGQATANFPITIKDDTLIDGPQTATISAATAGGITANTTITVVDNETTKLTMTLAASAKEGDAPLTGTVSLTGSLLADLVISLSSDDPSELTVPATITIPAGQTSATFTVTVIDDSDLDGTQVATITAATSGFASASRTVSVTDNDAHHFTLSPVANPQIRGAAFSLIVTARDVNDAVVTNFSAPVALSADAGGQPVAVSPGSLSGFVNGVWTGPVTVNAFATGVVLAAESGGRTSPSNSFDVINGPLDHFVWSSVPSPQTMDGPFAATVTAVDKGNNPVSFSGLANLAAIVSTQSAPVGAGTYTWQYPFYESYPSIRTQTIYPASVLGGAGRLTSLALNVGSTSSATFNNWTIRLKPTSQATFSSATWETSGWTVVHVSNAKPSSTGWLTFDFQTPFDYDGVSNLLVDFSFRNSVATGYWAYCTSTYDSLIRSVTGYSNASGSDPLTWGNDSTNSRSLTYYAPNIQLGYERMIGLRPSMTGNFVAGSWSGSVSMPFTSTTVKLRADDGSGHQGWSNSFTVTPPTIGNDGSATVFTEGFESGSLNPAYWKVTGTANYRTQTTTSNGPNSGTWHMTMDTKDSGGLSRNEGTLTVDLLGRSKVVLKFWAKIFNDEGNGPPPNPFTGGADFDGVAISADGNTWWEVQSLRSPAVSSSWVQFTVDLDAAIAARSLAYNSAFKIRFNQYDDNPITTDGIAIDDIAITALPLTAPMLSLPAQVSEGDGLMNATVTLPFTPSVDTVVNLESSAPAKVTVPAMVTIPAGQLTAVFALTLLDDALLDGDKVIAIRASAPGMSPGAGSFKLLDNETATLALTLPSGATEGAGTVQGTLALSAVPSGNIVIALTSSDTQTLTVPATVSLKAGESSATFPMTVLDDSKINGTRLITVTAAGGVIPPVSKTMPVLDNENLALTLSLNTVVEGSTGMGYVYISGTLASPLTVALSSGNPARATVPATATIAAGSTSGSFVITGVNNTATDGSAQVNITASAAGFTSNTGTTTVYDNDLHHFAFNSFGTSRIANQPFSVTCYAQTIDNITINSYSGSVPLKASAGGTSLPMTPAAASFSSGYAYPSVSVGGPATGATLQLDDGAGHTGTSVAFNLTVGSLDHFAIDPIAPTQQMGSPIPVAVTAKDAYNNTVTGFTGSAALTVSAPARNIGTGTYSFSYLFESATQQRNQCLYLASELGPAGKITSLAFNASPYSTGTISTFTIRMKPTTLSAYGSSPIWESTGWTTVYQGSLPITKTGAGWITIPLTTAFDYDGTSNLLVDFSHNGTGVFGTVYCSYGSSYRTISWSGSSTDPLTWSGTTPAPGPSNAVPNLRLRTETIPASPTATGAFVNGAWSGNITVGVAANAATVQVSANGLTGESNVFSVQSYPILTVSPADGLVATGSRGGPVSPTTKTWTLSNPGSQSLNWTAAKAAAWLDVSPSSGTLASGASVQVTATVNAPSVQASSGHYVDTVAFTNTSNGMGNTTRPIDVTISPVGELVVAPGVDWAATGPLGGPFTPATASYTLSNPGDAALNWTAAASQPWIQLSSTSGTLAPGGSTTVAASLYQASSLDPDSYSGSLSFANTTSGRGSVNRPVSLNVVLPSPVLQPEPPVTSSNANTVSWNAVADATAYEVQASNDPLFTSPNSSGWITGTSYLFTGLSDGVQYYYRVRAQCIIAEKISTWSQTEQAEFDTSIKSGVVTTAFGSVGLEPSTSGPLSGRPMNANFENGTLNTTGGIDNWTMTATANMGAQLAGTSRSPMPTSGSRYANTFTYQQTSHVPGDSASIAQSVDFTGCRTLLFDVALFSGGTWANTIKAEARIDGIAVWSSSTYGSYRDRTIDVSSYTGLHTLEFSTIVQIAGTYDSQWALWDNIRLIPATYAPGGTLISPVITPTPWLRWGALNFVRTTPPQTTLTMDVLTSAGAALATNIAAGTDLNTIAAVRSQPSIRLRANFTTSSTTSTPQLDSWSVASVGTAERTSFSSWSSLEQSTQDAVAPGLSISSPTTTKVATYTLAGTASDTQGISTVTVNGIPASSSDGFAHWSITTGLGPGANSFVVEARDKAVPPNIRTRNFTVALSADTNDNGLPDTWESRYGLTATDTAMQDRDRDGLLNILEYALALDPTKADGATGSWTTVETKPADGLRYLVLHYRRRIGMSGWKLEVETSPDAVNWSSAAVDIEEALAPTPAPGGESEVVHTRLLYPLGQSSSQSAFVRLRVRSIGSP